mmetsp:Transcript_24196/g.47248  ORF Transcript_24196/g.47248 Transcript_24196/m.47248 type:complete len:81 (+) Transcript_24196:636-878(+)
MAQLKEVCSITASAVHISRLFRNKMKILLNTFVLRKELACRTLRADEHHTIYNGRGKGCRQGLPRCGWKANRHGIPSANR